MTRVELYSGGEESQRVEVTNLGERELTIAERKGVEPGQGTIVRPAGERFDRVQWVVAPGKTLYGAVTGDEEPDVEVTELEPQGEGG